MSDETSFPRGASGPLSSLIPAVAKAHRKLAGSLLQSLGLAPGQEFVLMLLWEESPQSQATLTRRMAVEPPTTAKALARLEKLGLITRQRSDADGRVVLVSLTPEGRALEDPVLSAWSELESATTAALTDEERDQLHRLLSRVHATLTSGSSDGETAS